MMLDVPESMEESDAVLAALDDLVRVARANIAAWIAVMDRVDKVHEFRRQGLGYLEMPRTGEESVTIIDAVSNAQERLTAAAAQFRRVLAHQLQAEGLSVAAVARQFGVSRQRVASLLAGEDRAMGGALGPDVDTPGDPQI